MSDAAGGPYSRALQWLDSGHAAEARQILHQLLQQQPGDLEARYLLAVCDYRIGNLPGAEAGFRAVIARRFDDHRPYHGLGLALEQLGQKEEAVQAFRMAASIRPDFEPSRHKLEEHGGASAAAPPPPNVLPPSPGVAGDGAARMPAPPSAGADSPSVSAGNLRSLVPLGARLLRFAAFLVLVPILLVSFAWFFGGLGSALLGIGNSQEAMFFGLVFGFVAIVLTWILRAIAAKTGRVRVRGIVRDPLYREERFSHWLLRAPEIFHVLSFSLELTDASRSLFPRITVEQTGKVLRGTLAAGTEVVVSGKPTRMNYLRAAWIQDAATGEQISMKGLRDSGGGWIWLLVFLGFVGGMLIIASQS